MKLIGLDVGTVRIGVARADSSVKIAVPAGMVPVDGNEFEQLARLSRVYDSKLFVLGLPRNNDGEETKQSIYVREFADALMAKIPGAKVYFQDETLTSVTAEERLKNNGKSAKDKRSAGDIDTEAAVIILQDFVEHFTEQSGGKLPKAAKKQTSKEIKKNYKKSHVRARKIAIILTTIILLLAAIFAGLAIFYFKSLEPANRDDDNCLAPAAEATNSEVPSSGSYCFCGTTISVEIPDGSTTADIATILATNNLIQNSFTFQIFTKLNNYDGKYKSGQYNFQYCSEVAAIAEQLAKGAAADVFRFTILPGETIKTIQQKLIQIGYSPEEVTEAFSQNYNHPVLAGKPENRDLEGYIYGETYEFYVGESVENIIIRTLDELYSVVTDEDLESLFAAQGLSLYQGITLASIVQKEARADDMPTVAQVFLTRLRSGIILGSDVTTKYALDQVDPDRNIFTNNTSALQVEECHNTRLYAGLPCGPISNPGKNALLAVAHPSDTNYLYFLTGDDSMMYYSYTESEHQSNIRKYCQTLCNVSL